MYVASLAERDVQDGRRGALDSHGRTLPPYGAVTAVNIDASTVVEPVPWGSSVRHRRAQDPPRG